MVVFYNVNSKLIGNFFCHIRQNCIGYENTVNRIKRNIVLKAIRDCGSV